MTYLLCYRSGTGRHIAHSKQFKSRKLAQQHLDLWDWNDVMHVVAD